MSIFQHPLLMVIFSLLVCPVVSQPGQGIQEVKSGQCTSAELIKSAADCQAAAKVLGLGGTVTTGSWSFETTGCSWSSSNGGNLYFNTNKASTNPCGDGSPSMFAMCVCVDPCPIGSYQNEESSKTCKSCLPGTYSDETGEATCKNCPAGKDSATGASNCTICCQAKANYSKYEKNCNMIKDATACYLIQFDHLDYTCNWNCDVTTVMDMHNVSQK